MQVLFISAADEAGAMTPLRGASPLSRAGAVEVSSTKRSTLIPCLFTNSEKMTGRRSSTPGMP